MNSHVLRLILTRGVITQMYHALFIRSMVNKLPRLNIKEFPIRILFEDYPDRRYFRYDFLPFLFAVIEYGQQDKLIGKQLPYFLPLHH